jgi:hypothetical protein
VGARRQATPGSKETTVQLTPHDVAAWVLKTRTGLDDLADGWRTGDPTDLRRCVHPTYRLGLVRPGDRCLLWLSGRAAPGVHAVGVVTEAPVDGDPDPAVHVRLHRLAEPLPRAELVDDPVVGDAEVLRAPFGSNPSYLTPAQLQSVVDRLDAADLRAAGWR